MDKFFFSSAAELVEKDLFFLAKGVSPKELSECEAKQDKFIRQILGKILFDKKHVNFNQLPLKLKIIDCK